MLTTLGAASPNDGSAMTDPPASSHTDRELPAYRHLPGRTPHPTRDPEGHSYGCPTEEMPDLNAADWRGCETYLYGIDLFNADYWWECHEVLEGLWHAAGIGTPAAHVLQAVIQCAAAQLKQTAAGARPQPRPLGARAATRPRPAGHARRNRRLRPWAD